MKLKTLLVLSTSMVMTSTAFAAEWVKPVPTTQDIVKDGTTAQYLYNAATQSFMLGGNDYQTRASASKSKGMPWKIESTGEGTYALVDSVEKFNEWRKTFVESNSLIWVDNNSGANCDTWTITELGGGKYKISNTAFADEFLGIATDFADTRLYLTTYFTSKDPAIEADYEWTAVSPQAYEEWQAKNNVYDAAMKLKDAIDDAAKNYPSLDLAAENKVYENTSSTLEEIQGAINSIPEKIKAAAEASASVEKPKDMTSMIVNASFEEGNINGWTTKNSKDTGAKENSNGTYHVDNADGNYVFNTWDAGYAITQTIESMPNGVYKLQGMVTSSDDCTNVYLLANSDHKAITLETSPETGRKQTYFTTGTMVFPTTDGKVTIGASGCAKDGKSFAETGEWWYKADNFHLYYMGNKADAWTYALDDHKSIVAIADGTTVTKQVKEEWNKTLEALTATDAASYSAALEKIAAAKTSVDENIAAWSTYIALAAQADKLISDDKYKEVAVELADYLTYDYSSIIKELKLSTEGINTEIENLQDLYEEAKSLTPAGTDVTSMILNPNFADEWANWTHTGVGGDIAADKNAKCAQAWNASNFNIYQEIKNAPVGVYEVRVQGFYRYLRGNDAWLEYFNEDGTKKTEGIKDYITNTPAKIYLNDNATPMANVFEYSVSPEYAEEHWTKGNYYTDPNKEKCYPNNMTDAGEAFDRGDYEVSTVGLVSKKGDILRIGMKGDSNQGNDSWAIFTRFKLIYQGYDAKVIKPELEKAVKTINTDALMGSDVIAEAKKAVEDANEALKQDEGKKMFTALSEIYAVQNKVETSTKLFSELTTKAETFTETLSNSEEARQSVIKEASSLSMDISSAVEGKTYTDAQATDAINKMAKLTKMLAVPGTIDQASDETPSDITGVITNNSFEEGTLNGWTAATGTGDTGAKDNNNATYNITNADGNYVFNTWNSSAIEGGFFVAQDIEDIMLPAGTYELKCLVASDANNAQTVSVNDYSTEVKTNGKETAEEVSVIFKLNNENEKIAIKVASNDWFKADKFELCYYGKNSSKDTSSSTGVETIISKTPAASEIYTATGMKVSQLQKGLNIIVTNAKAKKVVKK